MNITIPPEALEAAKEAITPLRHNQFVTTSQLARAACLAMLKAWQTEKHKMIVGVAIDEVGGQCPAIILPLPQENTDD
jgi:hypothetical protein